jgi:hypothetical protein
MAPLSSAAKMVAAPFSKSPRDEQLREILNSRSCSKFSAYSSLSPSSLASPLLDALLERCLVETCSGPQKKWSPVILVDSSVWIDHLRGKNTPQTAKLQLAVAREPILVGDSLNQSVTEIPLKFYCGSL